MNLKQNKTDSPERRISIIILKTIPDIMRSKFTALWILLSDAIIITFIFFPQIVNFNEIETLSNQLIGFLGLIIALISLRAYDIKDLVTIYLDRGKRNNDASHTTYYQYLGEYYLAIILWATACLATITDAIIDFSSFPQQLMVILHLLYGLLLLANIIVIINLLFSSFDRLTNKVILETVKKIIQEKKNQ